MRMWMRHRASKRERERERERGEGRKRAKETERGERERGRKVVYSLTTRGSGGAPPLLDMADAINRSAWDHF
jgi:hypothetical protein